MAVTQRRKTLVNPARRKNAGRRRKLSAKQIAAGFGGKRRQSASKHRRRKPAVNVNRARRKPAARTNHRRRKNPGLVADYVKSAARRSARRRKTRANLGKIISFSLPKESGMAATKRNRSRKASTHHRRRRRPTQVNRHHRRRTHRNPSMGDLTGLVTSAVFTVAGAVASKYLTQMVLTTSNTGIMGYLGNLVSAFLLSWAVKAFMKNDKAAGAVLAGGMVQVVLRLINDYTPFGQYTSQLGMGDYGIGNYMPQNFLTPQRLTNGLYSANLQTYGGAGMSGCGSNLYTMNGSGLYAA